MGLHMDKWHCYFLLRRRNCCRGYNMSTALKKIAPVDLRSVSSSGSYIKKIDPTPRVPMLETVGRTSSGPYLISTERLRRLKGPPRRIKHGDPPLPTSATGGTGVGATYSANSNAAFPRNRPSSQQV